MHVTLLVLLPTFTLLTWWQFERAYNGNTLSWAYTFEWPLFGGYAIYVWWQLIHDDPTVFTRRQDVKHGPDGEPLGPEEQPGWALSGGRRASRRVARAGGQVATVGVATMTGSTADQPPSGSVVGDQLVEVEVEVEDVDEEDPELAEYNRYLADLNAGPDTKRW